MSTDGPRVMPGTRMKSSSWKWWPGTDRFAQRIRTAQLPVGRGSAQADPSQSRRARQISRGYVCSPFFFSGDTDFIRILELLMDPNPGRAMRIICKSRLSRFRWSRDVRSQPKRSLKSVDWTISARPLTARSGHSRCPRSSIKPISL